MELQKKCPICGTSEFEHFITGKDYFLSGESFQIVRCEQCGFRFTNQRPEAEQLGRYYQSAEYISHSNTRKGIFNFLYQQVRKYSLFRKHALIIKFHHAGAILDIGCATGHFLNFMQQKGWKTTGIEPDEKTRAWAKAQFGLQIYPEEQLKSFAESSFDVITLWHVLEHVSDLNSRMEQIKRLLKQEGILLIAVPNCESYDAEKYKGFWAGYDLPRHLYHFSVADIQKLTNNFGLNIEETKPMKLDAYYVSLLSEKYKTGKMRWCSGLWNGFLSNFKAADTNNFSSLIFVIKHSNTH